MGGADLSGAASGPVPALALRGGDTSYILDIPTELTVSGSGWNGTNGIDA